MKKSLLIFLLIPLRLYCQDVTGVWTGTMYNDTTKLFLPYELLISEENGKLTGYSHTTFTIDGIPNVGVKFLKIIQKKGKVFTEDLKLIWNNYSIPPAKGVHVYSLLDYSEKDSVMILNGPWNTNLTREYRPVTGTIHLQKQKKITDTKIIVQLEKMNLLGSLSFMQQPKHIDVGKVVAVIPLNIPTIIKNTEPAADIATRKIETIETVFFKSDSLVLSLFDNGIVDGDTVTILMNGKVIWPKQGLTEHAINKTVIIPAGLDSIQLIMYAENLGSIPPNTGLLVVRDGGKDYQIMFSGDLQRNAAIILKRQPVHK